MRLRLVPGKAAILGFAAGATAVLGALLAGAAPSLGITVAAVWAGALVAAAVIDVIVTRREWQASTPQLVRALPPAFALGVRKTIHLTIAVGGKRTWRCRLYDH